MRQLRITNTPAHRGGGHRQPASGGRFWPALALSFALLALGVAAPSGAAADPLAETEPNNDALHANGPIPPDGYLATRSTPDDHDFFILRLQGRRQITMTLQRVSGCDEQTNLNSTSFSLVARDGTTISDFSNMNGGNGIHTDRWTTPRDATEYVGNISGDGWWEGHQCQVLIRVSPADALITGPLPPPSFVRTLSVTNPGPVPEDTTVNITASGSAADDDRVAALWTTGGCPAAPDENARGIVLGDKLATGPYSVTLATTSPGNAGTATLCTWLYDTDGKLEPLLRQQTIQVGPLVDADHDGSPAGTDCNDGDAAIKPGAPEIRGNKVDENCDGIAAPYLRINATARLGATRLRTGSTRINSLVLRHVPRSFGVLVRCSGRGCRPGLSGTFRAPQGRQTLSLTAKVKGMRLAPGAKLSLKVYAAGYRSRIFSYTMQRRSSPARVVRCANPGSTLTFGC